MNVTEIGLGIVFLFLVVAAIFLSRYLMRDDKE
jgi:Na+-transporting methylmalonyl-CoA/oxaloacetate decarboxylase gamma subunit